MATYYWVGGNGTWNTSSNTNWATTSGGAGGNGPPTSADAVILDANSGTSVVTLGENVSCLTLAASAFSGTLAFVTNSITITGSGSLFSQSTTMTVTGTPVINLTNNTSSSRTLSISNVIEVNAISYNINAGTGVFAHTNVAGIKNLDFTGFSGSWQNNSASIFGDLILSTGMTVLAGANNRTFGKTSGVQKITTASKTLDFPITFGSATTTATYQLVDACTVGSTRAVTLTGGTLDLNNQTLSCGLFSSNNSNTRSIAFGTGNITLTGSGATIWTTSTPTNLTYTGTPVVNCTYAGSTGTRTITSASTSGSITSMPTINVSAGSDIVLFTNTSATGCVDLNFTGFTGTCSSLPRNIYGNTTFVSGMTLTSTATIVFAATSGTKSITTAGLTLDYPITFNGIGGTWSFADALTQGSTKAFTIANGTVKLKAGATSTVGSFVTSGTTQKYLQSTTAGSQATLSQASGTVNASYLTIRDITATGGATFNAYVDYNNVDQGDNTGWDFSNSPAIDNEFPIALRSFTQPKRF